MSLDIPSSWFDANATVSVFGYLENSTPVPQHFGEITLIPRLSFELPESIIVFLPQRILHGSERVPVQVYSTIPGVFSYRVVVTSAFGLNLVSIHSDQTYWSITYQRFSNERIVVAAFAIDESVLRNDKQLLFTIECSVDDSISHPTEAQLGVFIPELNDAFGQNIRVRNSFQASYAYYLSSTGLVDSDFGMLDLVADTREITFATLPSSVFNSASLGEPNYPINIHLSGLSRAGAFLHGGDSKLSCSVHPMEFAVFSHNCTQLLIQNISSSFQELQLSFSTNGEYIHHRIQNYTIALFSAKDFSIELDSNTLNSISTFEGCEPIFQASRLRVLAKLSTSKNLFSIDITHRVRDYIFISNTDIAHLIETKDGTLLVKGVSPGSTSANLYLTDNVVASAPIIVSVMEVAVEHMNIVPVTRLASSVNLLVRNDSVSRFDVVSVKSQDFRSVRDTVILKTIVLYDDGLREDVEHRSGLSFEVNDTSILVPVLEGPTAEAFSSGSSEVIVSWQSQNCPEPIGSAKTTIDVTFTSPKELLLELSDTIIAPPNDDAACIGISTSISMQVIGIFEDNVRVSLSEDSRLRIALNRMDGLPDVGLSFVHGSSIFFLTEPDATAGDVFIHASLDGTSISAKANVSIHRAEDLFIRLIPFPSTNSKYDLESNATPLNRIGSSDSFQRAKIVAEMIFLPSRKRRDVSRLISVQVLDEHLRIDSETNVISVADATVVNHGQVNITVCSFMRVVTVDISQEPVFVSSIDAILFPSALESVRGSVYQVEIDVTFDDGTHFPKFDFESFPSLVHLSINASVREDQDAVAFNSNTGEMMLLESSADALELIAYAIGRPNVTLSKFFTTNIHPAVGDVDMGFKEGIASGSHRTQGEVFHLPLRVNTGTSKMAALDVSIEFNHEYLEVIDVSRGKDWAGGFFKSTWDESLGKLTLGGLAAGLSSSDLEAAIISFRVREVAITTPTFIRPTVVAIASTEMDPIGDPTPRDSFAGRIPVNLRQHVLRRSSFRQAFGLRGGMHASQSVSADLLSIEIPKQASLSESNHGDNQRRTEHVRGDTNQDGYFNTIDVQYLQNYLLNFDTIDATEQQLKEMDADQSGNIDMNDVSFLLRVLFSELRFIRNLHFDHSTNGTWCTYSITMGVFDRNGPAVPLQTDVFLDLESKYSHIHNISSQFKFMQGTFDQQKPNPFTGILLRSTAHSEDDQWILQFASPTELGNTSVTVAQVTRNAQGLTSSGRAHVMTGLRQPPFYFEHGLTMDVSHGNNELQTSSLRFGVDGYNPLQQTSVFAQPCLAKSPITPSPPTTTFRPTIKPPVASEDFFSSAEGIAVIVVIVLVLCIGCCCLFHLWRRCMPDEDDEEKGQSFFGRSQHYNVQHAKSRPLEHDTPNITLVSQQHRTSLPPSSELSGYFLEENRDMVTYIPEHKQSDNETDQSVEAVNLGGEDQIEDKITMAESRFGVEDKEDRTENQDVQELSLATDTHLTSSLISTTIADGEVAVDVERIVETSNTSSQSRDDIELATLSEDVSNHFPDLLEGHEITNVDTARKLEDVIANPFDPANQNADEDLYSDYEGDESTAAKSSSTKNAGDTVQQPTEMPGPSRSGSRPGVHGASSNDLTGPYLDVNRKETPHYFDVSPHHEPHELSRHQDDEDGASIKDSSGMQFFDETGQPFSLEEEDSAWIERSLMTGTYEQRHAESSSMAKGLDESGRIINPDDSDVAWAETPIMKAVSEPHRRDSTQISPAVATPKNIKRIGKQVLRVTIHKSIGEPIGFGIYGGIETGERGIFVSFVDSSGSASEILQPNDEIFAIGFHRMQDLSSAQANQVLEEATGVECIKIIIARSQQDIGGSARRETLKLGPGKFMLSTPLRSRRSADALSSLAKSPNLRDRQSVYDETYDISEFSS